jgi:serine/threonine kinase 32
LPILASLQVRVVQHKQTKQLLALKYINKAKCCKMKAVANIIQERRLLEEVRCLLLSPGSCGGRGWPLARVINPRSTTRSSSTCATPSRTTSTASSFSTWCSAATCVVRRWALNAPISAADDWRPFNWSPISSVHLDRLGGIEENAVRFMMVELASALDYLHSIRIVHRDLKPDNVLLDERGHVHLTDFNIAVHFAPSGRQLTGIAGSMAYMAPEVLSRRGYSCQIDWWSLGVVLYELLFGRRPFRGKTNSALTESIAGDRLCWPEDGDAKCSADGKAFIAGVRLAPPPISFSLRLPWLTGSSSSQYLDAQLLERDPQRRLGWRAGGGGLEDIKRTAWLSGFDWPAMLATRGTPLFVPDSKKANFDATHELEELLLEENPLKARKRKPNQDVALMSTDMRMMEEQ